MLEAINNRMQGVWEDILTKGGRRVHALAVVVSVFTLAVALLMLCIGAIVDAFKNQSGHIGAWGVPIIAVAGPLGLAVTSVYKHGKSGEIAGTSKEPNS